MRVRSVSPRPVFQPTPCAREEDKVRGKASTRQKVGRQGAYRAVVQVSVEDLSRRSSRILSSGSHWSQAFWSSRKLNLLAARAMRGLPRALRRRRHAVAGPDAGGT